MYIFSESCGKGEKGLGFLEVLSGISSYFMSFIWIPVLVSKVIEKMLKVYFVGRGQSCLLGLVSKPLALDGLVIGNNLRDIEML